MMFPEEYLQKNIETKVGTFNIPKISIPEYITENIKYNLFEWQSTALRYFLAFENPEYKFQDFLNPNHLMFNMATGTGKTLLMACLILYYYKKGYRDFIFFVNQNNIVGKTEENFINPLHSKYLFKDNIVIDDKTVKIRKVNTFSDNSDDIQILFTTIQSLHNSVYRIKENCVYLKDLQKRKLILLGDEAHHLNALTERKGKQSKIDVIELKDGASKEDLELSWENTIVNKILFQDKKTFQSKNENVLLEFTATVPRTPLVKKKYKDKIIFKYDLKEFLKAGYTKEINLISSNYGKKVRILQALLFNWYRHKIGLENNLINFKPVILFRSKTIAESEKAFEEFKNLISSLQSTDFNFINQIKLDIFLGKEIYERGKSRILDIKKHIDENPDALSEIIAYIKDAFQEKNCIITNSKTNTTLKEKTTDEQEKLLNSLEDKNNNIRAIFTVKRLNEGWDVLNLFDIVRLYEGQTQGGSNTKASETTTSEVQLIGRGVRYYPFEYENKNKLKRKFDNDLENELRSIEEFFYHSYDNENYLYELKSELKNQGYLEDNKVIKLFELKENFKNSNFYKEISLWLNKRENNPNRRKSTLKEMQNEVFHIEYKLNNIKEEELQLDKVSDITRYKTVEEVPKTIEMKLSDFEKQLVFKSININAKKSNSIFRFENLKEELKIDSINDLFNEDFLGNFKFNIVIPQSLTYDEIPKEFLLDRLIKFFEKIEKQLKVVSNPYIGSEFTNTNFKSIFEKPKEKSVLISEPCKKLEEELTSKDWYVLNAFNGTSEEISLINFIESTMGNLKAQYNQVYLLRNEEIYTIYNFQDGKGFQPDFLLFLKKQNEELYYQVFIEPKGDQFVDNQESFLNSREGWKEQFLKEISQKYGNDNKLTFNGKDYVLYGFPLFNSNRSESFKSKYFNDLDIANNPN